MTNHDIAFAPAHMNQQRAAAVGMLGIQYYKEGKTETGNGTQTGLSACITGRTGKRRTSESRKNT